MHLKPCLPEAILLLSLSACSGAEDDSPAGETETSGTAAGESTTTGGDDGDDAVLDDSSTGAATCGDGTRDADEACDDGPLNGQPGQCALDCSGPAAVCGDGTVQRDAGEVCDDGVVDGAYGGCMPDCSALAPHCGDGRVEDDHEQCDDGDDTRGNGCNPDCVPSGAVLQTLTGTGPAVDMAGVALGPDREFVLHYRMGASDLLWRVPVDAPREAEDPFVLPADRRVRALAFAPGGELYVAGQAPTGTEGATQGWLGRLDEAYEVAWETFTEGDEEWFTGVDVGSEHVIVTGFRDQLSTSSYRLSAFTPDVGLEWESVVPVTNAEFDGLKAPIVLDSGEIVATGEGLYVATDTLQAATRRYTAGGQLSSVSWFGSPVTGGGASGTAICADRTHVYVVGTALWQERGEDAANQAFVTAYTIGGGTRSWMVHFGGGPGSVALGVGCAVTPDGAVVLLGTEDRPDLRQGFNMLLVRIDDGVETWRRSIDFTDNDNYAAGVAVDPETGTIWVGGNFRDGKNVLAPVIVQLSP